MNSGAECSSSRNPIAQFTKHTSEDRTLQHERFGPGGAANPATMRASNQPMNMADRQMMNNFMSGEAKGANAAFSFDQMRHELGGVQAGPAPQKGWANDFAHQSSAAPVVSGPEGIIRSAPSPALVDNRWGSEFQSQGPQQQQPMQNMYGGMTGGMGYMPQMSRMYTPSVMSSTASATAPQSSRIVELDNQNWEAHFKQIEETANTQAKGKGVSETAETQEAKTDEVKEAEAMSKEAESDFETVWNNLRSQVFDNMDDWNTLERDMDGNAWDRDFNQFTMARPDFGKYQFEEDNKFMEELNPFAIGVQIMESGGKLSEAALAFEAAVQKDQNHAEAWCRLGCVQAQNEKEDTAIRALERCIELQPGNLTALMTLAVSYTNESYENAAYSTLEKWIATKYPAIVGQARSQDPNLGNDDKYELHGRVTELFIRAAQLSPDGANMDADLQDGLGVLFYGSEEFDKAIDCFNAGLAVRPQDPLLWNRLGATLANSNRSEEAIEAYSKALELRPSFVRARYNLGVSCVNIGCYHEAAQHLLTALSMNSIEGASSDNVLANQSTNLLSTLKRVFLAMNRRDLSEKVGNGMDINFFRSEFDF